MLYLCIRNNKDNNLTAGATLKILQKDNEYFSNPIRKLRQTW